MSSLTVAICCTATKVIDLVRHDENFPLCGVHDATKKSYVNIFINSTRSDPPIICQGTTFKPITVFFFFTLCWLASPQFFLRHQGRPNRATTNYRPLTKEEQRWRK